MLILIVFIGTGLLLAFIYWTRRSNSPLHVRTLNWNAVLLAIAQSFILSLWSGRKSWLILGNTAQSYSDFVSGTVGFSNTSKTIEYYALLCAIFTFVVFFLLILKLYEIDDTDQETEHGLIKLSLFALVPSAIMAGQSLQMANTDVLLNISFGYIALSLLVIAFLKWMLKKSVIKAENVFSIGSKIMLAVTFFVASEYGMALFLPKFAILLNKAFGLRVARDAGILTYQFGVLSLVLLGIYALLLLKFKKRLEGFGDKLNLGLALSQVGIPLLFSVLLSPPVMYSNGVISLFRYRLFLYAIILGLGTIAYIDLFRRFRSTREDTVGRLVSPWVLVAILVYLQSINTGWPSIALDEYHFGEFYLPWWSFQHFGSLPYADFQPARGLVNYVPGFLTWLFYDNSFSGQILITNHFSALYVFLAFFGLRKIIGDFVAFLSVASLFIFAGWPSGNLVVVVACLAILLKVTYDRNYVKAFWLWVGFSILIPLFSIAEGSVFILGTLPLGLWLLFQAYRTSTRVILISLVIFFLTAGILVLTTDVDRVLISAIRYLLEESGVNDVANGIIWQHPTQSYDMVTTGYLWQFIRFSWLLLLIPIVVRLVLEQSKKETIPDQLFLVALFIICIILIPRAAGRIDISNYSRPGLTSIAMVFCSLPFIVLPPIKNNMQKASVVLLLALLFGILGNQESSAQNAKSLYRQVINEPNPTLLAKDTGLNIGEQVLIDQNQLKRQVRIKKVLGKLLAPQETYFDVTNHIADYGFQNRQIPVAVPAIYNASSVPVQNRIIDQLEKKQVPLVLLYPDNIFIDGGPISIRDYAVYKYLLKNYLPFQDEAGYIWMIRKGEEQRLAKTIYKIDSDEERLALLSPILWQKDLAGLPAAWGNSVQSLKKKMANPKNLLEKATDISAHNLQKLENGDWQVSGPDPYLVIALPPKVHGDLLLIDTSQKITGGPMEVFWQSDLVSKLQDSDSFSFWTDSSKFIVPVASAPSWLLSENVQKIRVDFPDGYPGIIHFNNLALFDRIQE